MPDDNNQQALQELAERELARRRLLAYVMRMYPAYLAGWVHKEVAAQLEQFLDDVINKRSPRLMIFMPPRVGKSFLASEMFPPWALGRFPHLQIVSTSYSASLVEQFSRGIRRTIREDEQYHALFPNVLMDEDTQSVGRWQLRERTQRGAVMAGGYKAVGVGGGLTGFGCFVAGTLVHSEQYGEIAIDELIAKTNPGKVLSVNHATGRREYRDIQAVSVRQGDGVYRVTTAGGRVVEATGNHPFFNPETGRYVPADQLAPGDALLCVVPDELHADGGGTQQASEGGVSTHVLLERVQKRAQRGEGSQDLRDVQRADAHEDVTVLRGAPAEKPGSVAYHTAVRAAVPVVLDDVQAGRVRVHAASDAVLLTSVREQGTLAAHVARWEPEMEERRGCVEVRTARAERVPPSASTRTGAGQASLRGVPFDTPSAGAPHRREQHEQRDGEPRDLVPALPLERTQRAGFRFVYDRVELVECVRETDTVYDVQVEGNHNFFAAGILVHNCDILIIDDPVANAEDANSEVVRESTWNWYATVARTRVMPGGGVLCIQTRWHDSDLSGRIIELMKSDPVADQFKVISYPALAEFDEPHRKAGEALHPERYDERAYAQIRASVGPTVWNALYQQNPVPDEGEFFRKDDFQYYTDLPPKGGLYFYGTWDCAISQRESADPTAGFIVAFDADYNLYVVDRYYGRFGSEEIVNNMVLAQQTHTPLLHWMEKEKVQMALGPFIEYAMAAGKINDFVIEPIPPGRRDKEARARSLQGLVRRRKVFFPRTAEWTPSVVGELLRFPKGKHDDQVDALAYAAMNVNTVTVPSPDPKDARPKSWRDTLWKHVRGTKSTGHMAS